MSFYSNKSLTINSIAQAVPGLIAILLILLFNNKKTEFSNLGILKFGHIKWYLVAMLLPMAAILLSYFIGATFGLFRVQFHLDATTFVYRLILYTLMWPLPWALAEELGWRGYLQPKLAEMLGLLKGILYTGIIWAVWHYIFIYWGGYYEAGNIIIDTLLFTITVILMSFSIGWLRWASQSIWPCVIFHSASNAAWQMTAFQFQPINANYIYFSGEAGLINIIFWSICLFIIMKKLKPSNIPILP